MDESSQTETSSGHVADEQLRLKRIYQGYRQSESVCRRWDAKNLGNRAILHERKLAVRRILDQSALAGRPLSDCLLLEIGCGSGNVLAELAEAGMAPGRLYGVDLLPERIEEACRLLPQAQLCCGNAETLPFDNDFFDLVLFFTVFSSILDPRMASKVAAEAMRVLRPGGAIVGYDFRRNNPWNPHVRGMNKQAVARLFPGFSFESHSLTLLPPLARKLGPATPFLYPIFASIPFLRTHYLGMGKKDYKTTDY